MFAFMDQLIVVTGAAGNLGRAVVSGFLQAGGTVCALDHRQGRLAELIGKDVEGLMVFEGVDITDRAGMLTLGERIQKELGPVDVLVNTVGGFVMGDRVDQISEATWQNMLNLNVFSLLNAAAAFVPGMVTAGGGKVVTIGSGASLKGGAKMGVYSAVKGAVLRLTESMAAELKEHHIRANCVLPGTIDTPQNRQAMPNANHDKWVTPEEVAEVVLFLSSPAADGITGAAVPVSGKG